MKPTKSVILALLGVLGIPSVALGAPGENLPVLGDTSSSVISLDQERELGKDFLRTLRSQVPTVPDPLIKEYLHFLIHEVALHSRLHDRRLSLIVIDSRELNAFAAPGGIIGVNLGLFLHAETEDEMSAILAHELAHLSQRHFARQVDSQRQGMVTTMVGLLASIVLVATTGSDAGLAAATMAQGAAQNAALKYSRNREAEADRIGIETLANASMNPLAMAHMFERLSRANRFSERVPEFLLTHPVTQSRIADSYNQAAKYAADGTTSQLDFQLMKMRALLLTSKDVGETIKRMLVGLRTSDPTKVAAYRYGLAITLTAANRLDEARGHVDWLLESAPGKISFVLAKADLHVAAGEYDEAAALLDHQVGLNPGNYPLSTRYAETLIQLDRPNDAEGILEQQTTRRSEDADLWTLLAETYGLADNIPGVHRARAEYFILNGNFEQAVKQLRFALPLVADNFQETSRITERLRDIDKMRRSKMKKGPG